MRWKSSAFEDDEITLSWMDLLKLIFGRTIRDGPCVARRR